MFNIYLSHQPLIYMLSWAIITFVIDILKEFSEASLTQINEIEGIFSIFEDCVYISFYLLYFA